MDMTCVYHPQEFAAFNIEDEGARQYLITYFINKIILYDDKVIIIYNHDGDNRTELGIDEIEEAFGSDLTQLPPAKKRQKRFLTTAKRGRTPLQFFIGEKFKENKPSKDLSPEAVKTIKKLTFKDAGNAQENRDKVREMKGRNKK